MNNSDLDETLPEDAELSVAKSQGEDSALIPDTKVLAIASHVGQNHIHGNQTFTYDNSLTLDMPLV